MTRWKECKQVIDQIAPWLEFIQYNWMAIRTSAAEAYLSVGRGAFFIDMSKPKDASLLADTSFPYLSRSDARSDNDTDLLQLLSDEVEWYNPERQIAFLFFHPEFPTQCYTRVLTEYPDGSPLPTDSHRRWCGFTRACPKCNHVFIGLSDAGKCPQCGHIFKASEEEYVSLGHQPIEPIGRYFPPSTPPEDFDDLYDRIREIIIRDKEEALNDPERLVWYAVEMDSEVRNGGMHQYFSNSSGDHAAELLRLLKNSSLEGAAVVLNVACAVFPNDEPLRDVTERNAQMEKFDDSADKSLADLNSEYYRMYPKLDDLSHELWRFWNGTT